MIGDLMGNMEERQKELQAKLREIKLKTEAGNGAVTVEGNASGEIENIRIDGDKVDTSDVDALEDLTLVAVNRVVQMARETEQIETKKMLGDMMPPGMDQLKNLLG